MVLRQLEMIEREYTHSAMEYLAQRYPYFDGSGYWVDKIESRDMGIEVKTKG